MSNTITLTGGQNTAMKGIINDLADASISARGSAHPYVSAFKKGKPHGLTPDFILEHGITEEVRNEQASAIEEARTEFRRKNEHEALWDNFEQKALEVISDGPGG